MCRYTGVEKGMKLCTAVQEGCGFKNTLRAHRYFAPLAKYFTVCITYQPPHLRHSKLDRLTNQTNNKPTIQPTDQVIRQLVRQPMKS